MADLIVVGVEESSRSVAAVALAQRLARGLGAELLLVNAYPWEPTPTEPTRPEYEHFVREQSMRLLERLRESADDQAVRTRSVATFAVGAALADTARTEGAAMIVVGPTRKSVRGHVALGSVAEALLVQARCPIVVAREGVQDPSLPISRIGVACSTVDDEHVVITARGLATRLQAEVQLLSVADPGVWRRDANAGRASAGELADAQREVIDRHLAQLADFAPGAHTDVLDGDPAEALKRVWNVDLLICGAREYGRVSGLHVGGVSKALIHEARCPVLVVPHAAAPAAH